MGYWPELRGLLLSLGSLLGPNTNIPGVSPEGLLDELLQGVKLRLIFPFWGSHDI